MTTNKSTFLAVITAGGILLITSAGLIVANAQTTSSSNSSNSSIAGRMNRGGGTQLQAIKTAMDNKDYEAWKTAVAATPKGTEMLKIIDTQAKFDRLMVGHLAKESGDTTTAEAIRSELGLPQRGPKGDKGMNNTNRQAEMTALDNSDFAAWKTAVSSSPRGEELLKLIDTQEKFNRFVELHKALKSGDKTVAEAIRTELGLPTPKAGSQGMVGKKGRMNSQNNSSAS